jgi:hypothetical protein
MSLSVDLVCNIQIKLQKLSMKEVEKLSPNIKQLKF